MLSLLYGSAKASPSASEGLFSKLANLLDMTVIVLAKRAEVNCFGGAPMDENRKRVIGIMAAVLAASKLAQYDGGVRVPATISAIADAIRWAEQITDHRGD